MIILLGAQKGGVGKSTLSINITCELKRQGKDVCLVDADRQGTCLVWSQNRQENESLPHIPSIAQYDNLYKTLKDLDGRYEYVVVDVAGRDGNELRSGLLAADMLIAPFQVSPVDLETLGNLVRIVEEIKTVNEALIVRSALVRVSANVSLNKKRKQAQEWIAQYPELPMLKSCINERESYRDTFSEGIGVVESKDNKAKAQVQLLVQEIMAL